MKQLIIIGGGTSVKEGVEKGLWGKLKGKYTFGLNYSYNYFESTVQVFVDNDFYIREVNGLEKLPLVMGKYHDPIEKIRKENTYMFDTHHKYRRDCSKGIYKASLVGIFALSLAVHILDEGEIYLLGYDFGNISNETEIYGNRPRYFTHFYQGELQHRGVGKVNYYDSLEHRKTDFGVYEMESKIKIYNVSVKSNINNFDKISYDEFFNKLDEIIYNQDELRTEIIKKIKELPCIR